MVDTDDNHRAYLVSSETDNGNPEKSPMTIEEQKIHQAAMLLDRASKLLDDVYELHRYQRSLKSEGWGG